LVGIHGHRPIPLIITHLGSEGAVDRDTLVVDAQPVSVGVSIAEQTALEHLVGGGLDSRDHVGGSKRDLLDLREVILRVTVEGHTTQLNERIVTVGPDLQ
jgi:hypothetical protein